MARWEASCFPSPVLRPKAKTPQNALVVLALGESNNEAIGNEAKSLACCLARPPQNSAGFFLISIAQMPLWTERIVREVPTSVNGSRGIGVFLTPLACVDVVVLVQGIRLGIDVQEPGIS